MRTTLSILCSKGDLKVTWDHSDPDECERARKEVADLKAVGYTFFLVDGTPADEVAAGEGQLIVKKLTAEEVVNDSERLPSTPPAAPAQDEPPAPTEGDGKKRRGRPPKGGATGQPDQSQGQQREVIAVRPVRGG